MRGRNGNIEDKHTPAGLTLIQTVDDICNTSLTTGHEEVTRSTFFAICHIVCRYFSVDIRFIRPGVIYFSIWNNFLYFIWTQNWSHEVIHEYDHTQTQNIMITWRSCAGRYEVSFGNNFNEIMYSKWTQQYMWVQLFSYENYIIYTI